MIRKLVLAAALFAALVAPAHARPQLHTQPIGWIDADDISCEQTSDHTCVVIEQCDVHECYKSAPTWEAADSPRLKLRVKVGTELVVLGEANNRAEVAIVIPADWQDDGTLRPIKPCRLATQDQLAFLVCR
jgi:hypothetical protein